MPTFTKLIVVDDPEDGNLAHHTARLCYYVDNNDCRNAFAYDFGGESGSPRIWFRGNDSHCG